MNWESEKLDGTGVHLVLCDRVGAQRRDLDNGRAVLVVHAEGVAGQLVGAVAQALAGVGDEFPAQGERGVRRRAGSARSTKRYKKN